MTDHDESGSKGGQTAPVATDAKEGEIPAVLWKALSEIFDDPNEWLDTANRAFGYVTPRSLIAAGQGDRVLDRLYGIQAGMFS